jgi:hypothetical protein
MSKKNIENNKIEILIDKLINMTKKGNLIWKNIADTTDIYSSENNYLKNFILDQEKGIYLYINRLSKGKIILTESFKANYNNGFIYLFKFASENIGSYNILALQANRNSQVNSITSLIDNNNLNHKINEKILMNLEILNFHIMKSMNEVDNFIENIINSDDDKE